MILAAGRGNRLRPLTDTFPKPLLRLDGRSLIARQIDALRRAGIDELCINLHWLGERIHAELADQPGIRWQWEETLLDTGGGIARALPWLCEREDAFVLVNADILHDFDLTRLLDQPGPALVLTPKAAHPDQSGDFGVTGNRVNLDAQDYVYTGMARLNSGFFSTCPQGERAVPSPLFDLLRGRIQAGELRALTHSGWWSDLGTPARLADYAGRLTDPDNNQAAP